MIRTFIAFDISESFRNECMCLTHKGKGLFQKGIKWVEPQNLHFTYLFLGDLVPSDKKSVIEKLSLIAEKLPIMSLKHGKLSWDSPNKPHCLWIEYIIEDPEFEHVRKRFIYDLKQEINYLDLDKKNFKFHLTIGRVNTKESKTLNITKWNLQEEVIETECTLDQISMYQSILYPQGPVYKSLAIFPLKGGNKL